MNDKLHTIKGHNYRLDIPLDQERYRRLKFRQPDTITYWFDIVTWPGYLAITGDMGNYVFSRLEDMFEFFRGNGPNYGYWSEKCVAQDGATGICRFSAEIALERATEWVQEGNFERREDMLEDLREDAFLYVHDGEQEFRAALGRYRWDGDYVFQDFFEVQLWEWGSHFQWCCDVLPIAIDIYDEVTTTK